MGDEVNLVAIEVIQDGLLQLDFLPTKVTKVEKPGFRVFVEPKQFFTMLGNAMQNNHEAWKDLQSLPTGPQ